MTLIYFDVASIPKLVKHEDISTFIGRKLATNWEHEKLNPVGSVMSTKELAHFEPNPSKIRVFLQFVRVVDDYDELDENSEYNGIFLEFKNYDGFRSKNSPQINDESSNQNKEYFFINRNLYNQYFISPKFNKMVQPGQLVDVWCIPQYVKRESDSQYILLYSISLISIIENLNDVQYLRELAEH
ncbi:hypothetical protein ACO0QE_003006 [Hanseniaspora vineae]